MRKLLLLLGVIFFQTLIFAQESSIRKFYSVTSGELIFAWSNATFNYQSEFFANNENESSILDDNNLRFSLFFHLGQYWHYNFSNNFGLITGLGIRNVGISSDERHDFDNDLELEKYKFVRRSYLLGVPLGFKLGSFKDHLYISAGGECELSVHYKQKYWTSHTRSGSAIKTKSWFGSQTNSILPSVYAGMQFPRGINIKLKYYLTDFLNHSYANTEINDFSRYGQTNIFYISMSWQVKSEKLKERVKKREEIFTSL
ncbi:MAG: hypothetical protein MI922_07975 [Bacteroidales bacterium]|nr:hypothetical protein [Bacteroidales bacterium]